jgi:catechol 2,3-dioxygenase-like lactoylglutathione lyase family enzyme
MNVRQLRVVVETGDYDQAVRFYRDVLGLPEELALDSDGGARVTVLTAGRATLELVNPAQRQMIDELEVGRQVSPRIRLAFEVQDAATTTQRLTGAGAIQVAPPTRTPWNSLNARLDAPAELHITIFEDRDQTAGPNGLRRRLCALSRRLPADGLPVSVLAEQTVTTHGPELLVPGAEGQESDMWSRSACGVDRHSSWIRLRACFRVCRSDICHGATLRPRHAGIM